MHAPGCAPLEYVNFDVHSAWTCIQRERAFSCTMPNPDRPNKCCAARAPTARTPGRARAASARTRRARGTPSRWRTCCPPAWRATWRPSPRSPPSRIASGPPRAPCRRAGQAAAAPAVILLQASACLSSWCVLSVLLPPWRQRKRLRPIPGTRGSGHKPRLHSPARRRAARPAGSPPAPNAGSGY